MRNAPRLFPSDLSPGERRVYGAATVFFVLVFLALTWPVYALFAGIRPLILGMPLSLFYIVVVLVVSFLALLAVYSWEDRRGTLDDRDGPRGDDGGGPEGGASGRGEEGPTTARRRTERA